MSDAAKTTENRLRDRRLAGIRAIKTAQRQLGIDDDTYRALLERLTADPARGITGHRSATRLSLPEQGRVLDYLRSQGAVNPKRPAGYDGGRKRPAPAAERAGLMAKVHALLGELHTTTGELHTLNYADAICKRNGWAERVDFCGPRDLHSLVGALSRTLRHRAAHPAPQQPPAG